MSTGAKGQGRSRPAETGAHEARPEEAARAEGPTAVEDGAPGPTGEAEGASTPASRPEPTGYELQDTLGEALGDVVGAELGVLEPVPLMLLLKAHRQVDLRRFMADHYVPARHLDLAAARRVLPHLQRARGRARERDLRWACGPLFHRLEHELFVATGVVEADDGPGLDALMEEYGPTALRLAALSRWGTYETEVLLAMLVVGGQLVPEAWGPYLDRLLPVAEGVVAQLKEVEAERNTEASNTEASNTEASNTEASNTEAGEIEGAGDEELMGTVAREAAQVQAAQVQGAGGGSEGTDGTGRPAGGGPAGAVATAEQVALGALRRWQEAAQLVP